MNKRVSRGVARRTCLGCLGLLTSKWALIKVLSRSGLSAMRRFIIALAVVFPRTLPVGWNGIPGVLDQQLIPVYGGPCEFGG